MPDCESTPANRLGLDDAYAVEGPDGNRRLYAAWAATYETSFIHESRYAYHQRVAEIFAGRATDPDGAVLDVGCGTGIVGVELQDRGITLIDGIDISPEMLTEARRKRSGDSPTYRDLIEADLTGSIALASNTYAGIVSAGTFTHGHLGPEPLSELIRVAAPEAAIVLGVNSAHYQQAGFGSYLDRARETGVIGDYELVRVAIYDRTPDDSDDLYADVVVFSVA